MKRKTSASCIQVIRTMFPDSYILLPPLHFVPHCSPTPHFVPHVAFRFSLSIRSLLALPRQLRPVLLIAVTVPHVPVTSSIDTREPSGNWTNDSAPHPSVTVQQYSPSPNCSASNTASMAESS